MDTGFGICGLKLERYYRKFGFSRAIASVPFIYKGLLEGVIVRFDSLSFLMTDQCSSTN